MNFSGGRTSFIGFGLTHTWQRLWSLWGSGYMGVTDPLASEDGTMTTGNLWTSQFDIALEKQHVLYNNDRIIFKMGQPMRLQSGVVKASTATSVTPDERIVYDVYTSNLSPSATSMKYDLGYNTTWQQDVRGTQHVWRVRLATSYLTHPQHTKDNHSAWTHLLSLRWSSKTLVH